MALYAINSGYWDTKAFNGKQMLKFRSKMDNNSELFGSGSNTYKVSLDSNDYIVGDGASRHSLEYDKTNSILHKLLTYCAVGSMAQQKEEANIIVALPLSIYNSLKVQYESYLSTRDFIQITINGERKYISFRNCRVFPEGIAALYANNPVKYKDSLIGILDFGSLTINGCIVNSLNLIKESVFTINQGTIILYNNIKHELNSRFVLNIQDYQVPYIIRDGLNIEGIHKDTIDKIISVVLEDHLSNILNHMRRSNWPIDSMPVMLTGGGSLLMEKLLKKALPGSFLSVNPVFDNCIGLYNVGEVVFRETNY